MSIIISVIVKVVVWFWRLVVVTVVVEVSGRLVVVAVTMQYSGWWIDER